MALRHLMLSSSCHRIVLATAPGVPTPQHRFADPQKLAAGFQLAFSRTGPKTVSCSPLPVVRFGGEHNVLSLHTHHRSSQDCTCRPAVAISIGHAAHAKCAPTMAPAQPSYVVATSATTRRTECEDHLGPDEWASSWRVAPQPPPKPAVCPQPCA